MDACVVRKVPSEFDQGLGKRSAIYIPFPQAVPLRATIDPANCLTLKGKKCKQPCTTACGPEAIDFEQQDEVLDLEVGAIIMATGFELWEPDQDPRYGYGRLDNVITSLEFERISNASGPTGGHIVCKNGEAPKSVAILHCIGSRDQNHQEYCSRVCCMYSLKFSHLIKEHLPETEVYELYIDMRCYGKGYEEFYRRLMDEGVHIVRGRAAEVTNVALSPEEEGRLVVKTEDTLLGIVRRIPADMVILSQRPRAGQGRQGGQPDLRLRLLGQRVLPRAAPQARAGQHRHRRHLHRRLLPVPQGHPGHGRPGGRRRRGRAGAGRQPDRQGRADDLVHRSREVRGLPHLREPSARTPRSSSTRRRASPRSSPPPARAAACASPPAAATCRSRPATSTTRSSPRSKGPWPSEAVRQ